LCPTFLRFLAFIIFKSAPFSRSSSEIFGCQCQRGRTNENPGFLKNSDALHVINSTAGYIQKENCRGRKDKVNVEAENVPFSKRRRKYK